ncbi:MAG TPA: hypothetical protein VFX33_12515 [Actinomycetales bacterium]|nr:hypothetical protein [Actinomycetales bacterium]
MDSGLIFPIIVALWLVFLVPHWVRRREHLSSSRAADRFSSAMRVLERRDDPARPSAERAPTYLLTPPRNAARDDVRNRAPVDMEDHVDVTVQVRTVRPVDRTPTRTLAPSLLPGAHTGRGPTTPSRDHAVPHGRAASRLLGLILLAALASIPVLGVLAVLGGAPGWSPAVGLALTALCVVWLRQRALRRRALRATRRDAAPVPAASSEPPVVVEDVRVDVPDIDALLGREADDDTHDRTWTPVPVPPPTYTLKQAAPVRHVVAWEVEPTPEPRLPAPAPAAAPAPAVAEAPSVRRVVPDLELVLERRRAAGE